MGYSARRGFTNGKISGAARQAEMQQKIAQMQEQIAKGLVFVNQLQCLKNEAALAPGDRITVRGLGRARIVALGGVSRKGRQFVRYAKNV